MALSSPGIPCSRQIENPVSGDRNTAARLRKGKLPASDGLMQIELEVFATLRDRLKDQLPSGRGTLEVPDGATIEQVAEQLDITLAPSCVIMVNGQMERDRTRQLEAESKLTLIPPVAGGQPCTA